MDKIIKEQYIVSLIVKEMAGTISEAENVELWDWLSGEEGRREIYEELKMMNVREEVKRYRKFDSGKGWNRYQALYGRGRKRILRRWISVAAVVIVVLTVGIWGGMRFGTETEQLAALEPGSSKAVLVLADGTYKELSHTEQEEVIVVGDLKLRNDGTSISYEKDRIPADRISFNELHIPTGGEYQLVLADGTHVWLNSETKLRYPVKFAGDKREVYLEGEAYFEVAKDKEHPFYVITPENVSVQVFGTSFNVRAYQDENSIEAVLVEGSVSMETADNKMVLVPGNKGCYDRQTKDVALETVNTKLYTEWRNGQFVFVKRRIEDIFRDLSRWYGIEVVYQNESVKNILFSGSLKRYQDIAPLLEAMEIAGGVTFRIRGRTLMVL